MTKNDTRQEKSYNDIDKAPELTVPPFRPKRPPGLYLPEDRTKADAQRYLTPGAFFKLFFTLELVQEICKFSNNYAEETGHLKPSLAKGWKPLTPEEFYLFISLLMYFSLVKLPRVELYWSTKPLFHGLWARAFMSKFRYKQIQTFLKVSNPETEDKADKLTKVRFLTEFIRRKCMKLWQPHETISIDERMVANKGRYSFRQYIRDKPTKWGMKLWVLADSVTGFTCNFEVYLGKEGKSKFGLGYDVVMKLCRHLFGMGYKLFMDNFYTSFHLLKDLLKNGIAACGTMLKNRKGFPNFMKNTKAFNKRIRGSMRWVRVGVVGCIQWKDNKIVNVLTTMHKFINKRTFCSRRAKVNEEFRKIEVSQPLVIKHYNQFMGGVDRSDQMIGKYKTLRRTSKFWKTIFYHMIDISKVNSFIMFQAFRNREKNKSLKQLKRPNYYSQFEFTLELIKEFSQISENSKVPLYQQQEKLVAVTDSHAMLPSHTETRRNCYRCYRLEKVERKSSVKCDTCDRNFCFSATRNCLVLDHQ